MILNHSEIIHQIIHQKSTVGGVHAPLNGKKEKEEAPPCVNSMGYTRVQEPACSTFLTVSQVSVA